MWHTLDHVSERFSTLTLSELISLWVGWVQSLDWTTGLTQTAKYNSFSAEKNKVVFLKTLWLLQLHYVEHVGDNSTIYNVEDTCIA